MLAKRRYKRRAVTRSNAKQFSVRFMERIRHCQKSGAIPNCQNQHARDDATPLANLHTNIYFEACR